MIDAARERLGPDADLRVADLLELELDEPVDAIFSTATFHWIADHERLFARLRAALRPGGQLVAQCGGEGNIDDPARAAPPSWPSASPTAPHFEGFDLAVELRRRRRSRASACWPPGSPRPGAGCSPRPAEPQEPREYLRTIVLGPAVQRLPRRARERYLDEVMAELGEPVVVDYVRLNIDAVA